MLLCRQGQPSALKSRGGARLAVGQGPEDGPHLLLRRIDKRDALDEAPRAPGRGRAPAPRRREAGAAQVLRRDGEEYTSEHRRWFIFCRREHGAHERPRLAAARVAAVHLLDARRGPRAHLVYRRRLVLVRGRDDVPPIVVAFHEPKAVAQSSNRGVAPSLTATDKQKTAAAPSIGIVCGREGRPPSVCESRSFR